VLRRFEQTGDVGSSWHDQIYDLTQNESRNVAALFVRVRQLTDCRDDVIGGDPTLVYTRAATS